MKKLFTSALALLAAVCLYAQTTLDPNIYASGLRVTQESGVTTIHYVLNAQATSVDVLLYNGDSSPAYSLSLTDNGDLTKGQHSVVLNLSTVSQGTYTWAIKAVAEGHNDLRETLPHNTNYALFGPRGVAVDNSVESDFFGRVYVAHGQGGNTSEGNVVRSTAKGIYIYDALMNPVSTAAYGGGVTWTAVSAMGTSSAKGNLNKAWGPYRIAVAEDGYVFVTDNGKQNDDTTAVYMMDPANPSASFVSVLGKAKGSNAIFHRANSLAVTGKGANRVLYLNDYTDSIVSYPIGNTFPCTVKGATIVNDLAGAGINNAQNTIARDNNGGFWVSQLSSSSTTQLVHFNSAGTLDFRISDTDNSSLLLSNTKRGILGLNPSNTMVAFGGAGTIRVLSISDGANGPIVQNVTSFTMPTNFGSNVDGVAFDVADNIYVVSAATERIRMFATPKANNSYTTPAKAEYAITWDGNVTHVTGVSFDPTSESVEKGKTITLTPIIAPDNATNQTVSWLSDNTEVATVLGGVVTGVSEGTAHITVTAEDGGIQATCTVTVYMNHVTAVNITPSSLGISMAFPNNAPLIATILPENATDKTIEWSSSDETIVTIDQNGVVTPVAEGTATIYATAADGDIQGACPVTVGSTAVAHISAWGLHSEKTQTGYKFLFNTNMAANSAAIVFYDKASGNLLNEVPVTVIAGENAVNVAAEDMPGSINQQLTWAVRLTGADNAGFSKIFESETLPGRGQLVVDASPESSYMGQIYYVTRYSTTNNANSGLYVFKQDPLNPGSFIHTPISKLGESTNTQFGFTRPSIDEEGFVWIADWCDAHSGIFVVNPADLSNSMQVFQGTRQASGLFTNDNGDEIGGSTPACFIYGKGDNRILFTAQEDFTSKTGSDLGSHPMAVYELGANRTWGDAPSHVYKTLGNDNTNDAIYVVEQGYWVSQTRSLNLNTEAVPALQFYGMDGTRLANFGGDTRIDGCQGSGFTIDPVHNKLYINDASSNILEFDIVYNEGVPSLTLVGKYYTGLTYITTMSFDYAGNLYVSAGASSMSLSGSMKMVVYSPATNGDNTTLVPAKSTDVVKPFFGALYEFGSNQEWHTGVGDGVPMTRVSDDVFAGEFTFTSESYFTFSGYSGSDDESPWSVINTRRLSAPSGNKAISAENNDELVLGGENSFKIAAGTYIIKVNTAEMKVYVNSKNVVENLYEVGNNQDWKAAEALPMTKIADNVFQGDFAFTNATSWFAFTATPGANNDDWDAVNSMRFGGTNADLVADGDVAVPVVKGDGNTNFTILPGTYRLRVDLNLRTLDVTRLGDAIQVSDVGYATYYNSAEAYTMPTGMEGYYFNTTDGLALKYEAGANVAADVALVLKADAGRYPLVFAESGNVAEGTNQLLGTDEETALEDDGVSNYYALSLAAAPNDTPESVGFYWMVEDNGRGAAFTNGAHKAYLKLGASQAPQRFYLFHGENNTTNITNVKSADEAVKFFENGQIYILRDGVIYDATGRRVR